jgi:hypothetical protein
VIRDGRATACEPVDDMVDVGRHRHQFNGVASHAKGKLSGRGRCEQGDPMTPLVQGIGEFHGMQGAIARVQRVHQQRDV